MSKVQALIAKSGWNFIAKATHPAPEHDIDGFYTVPVAVGPAAVFNVHGQQIFI